MSVEKAQKEGGVALRAMLAAAAAWAFRSKPRASMMSVFGSPAPLHHPGEFYGHRSGLMKKNLRKLKKRQRRRAFLRQMNRGRR